MPYLLNNSTVSKRLYLSALWSNVSMQDTEVLKITQSRGKGLGNPKKGGQEAFIWAVYITERQPSARKSLFTQCHSIQFFRLMRHWVFAIWEPSGAMNHGIPWHLPVYFGRTEEWVGKAEGMTQHTRIHSPEQPLSPAVYTA